jgi:serine/threonine protein kinase|tara:strand:+ start:522 stop:1115 length:594 start_codon:yes stop_codon:yes gene_type:complete
LAFGSSDNVNKTAPGHVKGNRSLVIQKNNCSVLDPLLSGLEQDEFLTFEEKYNIDHKSILGEGASCQVKRCMFKKSRQVQSNEVNMISKHLTPAQEVDEILNHSDMSSVESDSDSEDSESKSMSIDSENSDNEINIDENAQDDENLAVKIVRSREHEITEMAYDEFKLLKTLDHPNIVKMHDAFYNESKQTMFLVMD